MLNELEKAHIYIDQPNTGLKQVSQHGLVPPQLEMETSVPPLS